MVKDRNVSKSKNISVALAVCVFW